MPAPKSCTVDDAVAGWIRHFWAADHSLKWEHSERELSTELATGVILAGRVDADGMTDIPPASAFFGEWKSSNPRNKTGWREKWRFSVQSLTYGLLMRENNHSMHRFTIRMAFKSDPPTFDHEWFEYSDAELDMWRDEVLRIAGEISALQATQLEHWPLNPTNCYRWGPNYPCERIGNCTKQKWADPGTNIVPRIPHLGIEQAHRDMADQIADDQLILDATRIDAYLSCPESYRGQYVQNEVEPEGEALTFGKQFHTLLDAYYKLLIEAKLSMNKEHNYNGRTTE